MKKILLIMLFIIGAISVGTYLYLRAVTPSVRADLQEQEDIFEEPEQQAEIILPAMSQQQITQKIKESIQTNDIETLAFIVKYYRVDINDPNVQTTPLEYALNYSLKNDPHYDAINMITFLVKHLHANINLLRKVLIEDSRLPFTPLTLAISIGVNNQIIETLIDLGAHINIHTNAGYSTLTLALLSNNIELATLLLKKGFDINLENNNGVATLEQILFHLSYNISQPEKERDIAAIKFLLAHGAYANRLNSNGFTPLKMARDYKLAPEVIDLLKKNAEEYRKAKTIAHWV